MPLTTEQLAESVKHIQFEAERLHFSWRAASSIGSKSQDIPNHTVSATLREAALLHCRVLAVFLLAKSSRFENDLLARQFFDPQEDWEPEVPDWWETDRQRLHKLLAHLTYDRVQFFRACDHAWDVDLLANDTLRIWNKFVATVPRPWCEMFAPVKV